MPLRLSSALVGLVGLLSCVMISPVSVSAACTQTIKNGSLCGSSYGPNSGGASRGVSIHNSYGATACVYLCQANGGYPALALTGTGGPADTLGEIPAGATHTVYINSGVYYTVLKEDEGHLYFHGGGDTSEIAEGVTDGTGVDSLTISSSSSRRRRLLSMMSDNDEQEEGGATETESGDHPISPTSRRLLTVPKIKVNV